MNPIYIFSQSPLSFVNLFEALDGQGLESI